MSRKRMIQTADQLKTRLSQLPASTQVDFFKQTNVMLENDSQDLLDSLAHFQLEFGELSSVFDIDRRRTMHSQRQTPKQRFVKAAKTVQTMLRADRSAKIVNPEISQKVKEAETQAVAQYLKKMQFEKMTEKQIASLKAYARPASSSSTKPPARRRSSNMSHISNLMAEDDDTVPGEFKDMQTKLLGNLQTHDNAIAAERQKLQDILSQRRSAAKSARTAHALSTANQLLTKQSEVEQGFEQAKADMENKLKTRISLQKHGSQSKNDALINSKPIKTVDSAAELAQFEERVGLEEG